jgi:hypothetical protein
MHTDLDILKGHLGAWGQTPKDGLVIITVQSTGSLCTCCQEQRPWVIKGWGGGRGSRRPTTDEGRGQTPNQGHDEASEHRHKPEHLPWEGKKQQASRSTRKSHASPAKKRRNKQTEGRGGRGGKPPEGNEPNRTQEQDKCIVTVLLARR